MTTSIRFYGTGLLLAVGLLGLIMTCPNWVEAIAVQSAPEPCPHGELLVGPSDECLALQKRCQAKARVVSQLRAGNLTLFEAASWFRFLNQIAPQYPTLKRDSFPGDTEEEMLCHQVLCWMKSQTEAPAFEGETEQIIARLEAELANRQCEFGRIELPPLSPGDPNATFSWSASALK